MFRISEPRYSRMWCHSRVRLGQSADTRSRLEPRAQRFISHVADLLRQVDLDRPSRLPAFCDASEYDRHAIIVWLRQSAPQSPGGVGEDTFAPGGAKILLSIGQSRHRVVPGFS